MHTHARTHKHILRVGQNGMTDLFNSTLLVCIVQPQLHKCIIIRADERIRLFTLEQPGIDLVFKGHTISWFKKILR